MNTPMPTIRRYGVLTGLRRWHHCYRHGHQWLSLNQIYHLRVDAIGINHWRSKMGCQCCGAARLITVRSWQNADGGTEIWSPDGNIVIGQHPTLKL